MDAPVSEPARVPGQPLRVLLVEHSPSDAELCLRELENAGFAVCADVVQSLEEYAESLQSKPYDVILADYRMPGWTGMDAFDRLQQSGKNLPFILVTGTLGEEAAVEFIKRGVTDYVLKDCLARLPMAVHRALGEVALRQQRARAEEALRQSEASFRLLFAHNPMPMWVYDRQTLRFLQVNDAAIARYGYSREEFLEMRIPDIRASEDVPRLLNSLERGWVGGRNAGRWRHQLKDGRIIDVDVRVHSLEFGGRPASLVVVQNITERLRAEAENTRLITAIEQSAEGVLMTDALGQIVYVNPAFTQITGYSREEVIGRNPRLLSSGRHDRAFYQNLWRTILEGRIWRGEIINRRKDGSLITEEMSITPVRDAGGEITHFIAIKQDITERKRAEVALRESEARYRELVRNAAYGIYRTSVDGRILDANPALVAMLGYASEEELRRLDLATDVYRNAEDRARLVDRLLQQGRVDGMEVEVKRKDGSLLLLRLSLRVVRDAQGECACFEGIAEDITERRAMEIQLRQVHKFEAIGQLAGGIAHDFNNVIGAILGWAEIGLDQTPQDSPLRDRFQKIHDQAERAAGLTRQLLAFARRQILAPHNINLNQVVTDLLALLDKVLPKSIELETALGTGLGPVRADPSQIEQVLMNLCLNARDAMPNGGQLLIETGNVEIDEFFCQAYTDARPGRYALLAVSDTGVGMDAATREHIFEPFFTTKETGKGTGLGLATVYGVIKQHEGFILVESQPGHGSAFRVYLPVSTGARETEERGVEANAGPVRGGCETILVAEDHAGVREMARATLEGLGYAVLAAGDGEEALRVFQRHLDSIALALLDMVMPKMSGPEVYAQMSAIKPDLAVVFATGYSTEAVGLDTLPAGRAAVLLKPYSPTQLGRKVRELLDRTQGGARGIVPSSPGRA